MECPECRYNNPDQTRFCGNCGASLEPGEGMSPTKTETQRLPLEKLPVGSRFAGRYQVIEELGKGGMGRVYKVLDTELKEKMALKLLNQEISLNETMIERFRNELKIARKISHRNVCRMFDLGEEEGTRYITMEFVPGEDLKSSIKRMGPLSVGKAVFIARQICEGLAEAHRLGVVHRDLKSRNIMIDKEGNTRIMDFGIARYSKEEGITDKGVMLGTPKYMSPEQVEGKGTDQRTDLYSLGVILYEMVTGQVPFDGDTALSIALKQKTEIPAEPKEFNSQIPEDLNHVILKCLEKDRDKRYQTAEDLLTDLFRIEEDIPTKDRIVSRMEYETARLKRRYRNILLPISLLVAAACVVGAYFVISRFVFEKEVGIQTLSEFEWKSSLAVLPVEDLSLQRDQEPLCGGMHDDIITKLSSIEALRVTPKLSVNKFKKTDKDIKEIGRELDVDYILTITLQKEGSMIRVNGRLSNAREGFLVKSYRYERNFDGYFQIQDDISNDIAEALDVRPVESRFEAIKRREPADISAYEYYVKGNHYERKYSNYYEEEDFETAKAMYQKALEIDPDYVLAYWGFGNLYEARFVYTDDRRHLDSMLGYFEKAFDIDPDLPEANLGLGWGYFYKEDMDSAYQSFKRALELEANNFSIHFHTGGFLKSIGLYRQAIKFYRKAIKLDPNSIISYDLLAICLMYMKEFQEGIGIIERALEIEPEDPDLHLNYARLLLMMGKYEDAEIEIDRADSLRPGIPKTQWHRAMIWAAKGEKEKALELLKDSSPISYYSTIVRSALGMKDETIRSIKEGIERGFYEAQDYLYAYPILINIPFYDNLRDDPRFQEIVRKEKNKYEEKLEKYGDL